MKHFTKILTGVLWLISVPLMAQNSQIQLNQSHKEIDQQVWKPFVTAFNTYDAQLYNSVHSDNVFRVYPGNIREGKAYKQYNVQRFVKAKKEGRTRVLEFKFIERKATKNRAYEVGFFKVEMMYKGKTSYYYGKFHVVIHKLNGRWQIVQDWDNSELIGKKVGEEEYARINTPVIK